MEDKVGFPSLGEALKYIFDQSGLLDEKGQMVQVFQDKAKVKSFQTALGRLKAEKGDIEAIFRDAASKLSSCLELISDKKKYLHAMSGVINDCLYVYSEVIKKEGTYLDQFGTIQWLLCRRLINIFSLSLCKHFYLNALVESDNDFPEELDWYLPTVGEEGLTQLPITKAFEWVYGKFGLSPARFHNPKHITLNNDRHLQNYQNALRWNAGERCRSWYHLEKNIDDSLDAIMNCDQEIYRREVNDSIRSDIKLVFFIARFSSCIFQDIEDAYGKGFVSFLLDQLQVRDRYFEAKGRSIEDDANEYIIENLSRDEEFDESIWGEMTKFHFARAGEELHFLNGLSDCSRGFEASDHFIYLIGQCERLRRKGDLNLDDVDDLNGEVKRYHLGAVLSWYINWLRAIFHYRNENFESAFEFSHEAFILGKYVAGERQYDLVNMYLELCAKTGNEKRFEKAVSWARFMGIRIRWLKDPHDKNEMEIAKAFFEEAKYIV